MPPFANTRRIKALRDDRRKSDRAPARSESSGVLGNRTGDVRVSENPVHRKVVCAFVHSPSPLSIELPLYIGLPRMSSGANWVSENSVHRKPGFREHPFSSSR